MGNQPSRKVDFETFRKTTAARYALLPSEADVKYTDVNSLLSALNSKFGTKLDKSYKGLDKVLSLLIQRGYDFGTVYARLRVLWPFNASGHSEKPARDLWAGYQEIEKWQKDHQKSRDDLVKGDRIKEASTIFPRRIWDLYAHRVIPYEFSCLPFELSSQDTPLPGGVPRIDGACVDPYKDPVFGGRVRFAVSHSWVEGKDLQFVNSPVNAYEWPVPLPKDITLDGIRNDLLALGAEYIWQDILCLRQVNGPPHLEDLRIPEWAVDVPTIGFIYRNVDFVVRYMNGLGKDFDPNQDVWTTPRHWSQRAWTLQEDAGQTVMDVGEGLNSLETKARDRLTDLLNPIKPSVDLEVSPRSIHGYSRLMAKRAASNKVDRVAGLAALLGCETMPTYKESELEEDAWLRLIDLIPIDKRLCMITQSPLIGDPESCCSWHTSWSHVMHPEPTNKTRSYAHEPFRTEVYIMKQCKIVTSSGTDPKITYEVLWKDRTGREFTLLGAGIKDGVINLGEYILVAEPLNSEEGEEWLPIASAWALCREIRKEKGHLVLRKVGNFRGRTEPEDFKDYKAICPVETVIFG